MKEKNKKMQISQVRKIRNIHRPIISHIFRYLSNMRERRANKETYNYRQKRIRDLEWNCVGNIIKEYSSGTFLDVGCGSSYALSKAQKLKFSTVGIDPEIGKDGVIYVSKGNELIKAVAEDMPFKNDNFDVVYSSHALEHFRDRDLGLKEIYRVLKYTGIALLVVPTGAMAFVALISLLMFHTHVRIGIFMFKNRSFEGFKEIFFPGAHGSYGSSRFDEIKDFSIKNWTKLISKYFNIQEIVLPGLYPYPDFPQFFPFIKSNIFSSSVIFICKKFR